MGSRTGENRPDYGAIDKARELQALVNERPMGMRAKSPVWLRGSVAWLAEEVVRQADARVRAEEALRKAPDLETVRAGGVDLGAYFEWYQGVRRAVLAAVPEENT